MGHWLLLSKPLDFDAHLSASEKAVEIGWTQ